MGIFRGSNGDAAVIDLYGIVPTRASSPARSRSWASTSSGHTYIGEINGFGQFGKVNSTLTTPGFYVGSAPVIRRRAWSRGPTQGLRPTP